MCGKPVTRGSGRLCSPLYPCDGYLIEPYAKKAGLPVRFSATKMDKRPADGRQDGSSGRSEKVLAELVDVMEKEGGLDREAALANMRFNFMGIAAVEL